MVREGGEIADNDDGRKDLFPVKGEILQKIRAGNALALTVADSHNRGMKPDTSPARSPTSSTAPRRGVSPSSATNRRISQSVTGNHPPCPQGHRRTGRGRIHRGRPRPDSGRPAGSGRALGDKPMTPWIIAFAVLIVGILLLRRQGHSPESKLASAKAERSSWTTGRSIPAATASRVGPTGSSRAASRKNGNPPGGSTTPTVRKAGLLLPPDRGRNRRQASARVHRDGGWEHDRFRKHAGASGVGAGRG